ncbi:hypothetical protein HMPREF1992_00346 [Selenomonas sp. oral taxon 892 str. F0426]|nr:hypothetical protein HMPREF1992_00346 [Selenomonas sp. oral taxon 892 str. F0426]
MLIIRQDKKFVKYIVLRQDELKRPAIRRIYGIMGERGQTFCSGADGIRQSFRCTKMMRAPSPVENLSVRRYNGNKAIPAREKERSR